MFTDGIGVDVITYEQDGVSVEVTKSSSGVIAQVMRGDDILGYCYDFYRDSVRLFTTTEMSDQSWSTLREAVAATIRQRTPRSIRQHHKGRM